MRHRLWANGVDLRLSERALEAPAAMVALREAKRRHVSNRTAALSIGVQKVANEKAKRGLYP